MLIIDRIEDGTAVIEDGDKRLEVPEEKLSPEVREGDVVTLRGGVYVTDTNSTEKRRRAVQELQDKLWE